MDGGILFYSMWNGYKAKEDVAEFLRFMQGKGVRIVDLHTSGHADADTVQALINDVAPQYIIPVHTENAEWFDHCEGYTVIKDKYFSL